MAQLYNDIKFANQNAKISEKYKDGLTKEHYHISAFYWFLKTNYSLSNDEIREILNSNNKFSFLRKLDNLPICDVTSVLEFNVNLELIKESLIDMDRKIYRQKQAVRDVCLRKIYPNNKEGLRQLYKRLNNVHEEIYDILTDEMGVSVDWLYPEKDEIEHLN